MDSPKKDKRHFTLDVKEKCWDKANKLTGRDPKWWRTDPAGNIVGKTFTHCHGHVCYEYDHTDPHTRGKSDLDNCEILQITVNRKKSAKADVTVSELKDYSYDTKPDAMLTSISRPCIKLLD